MLRQIIQISRNHYQLVNEELAATIKGNFKDAMVSITITKLPAEAAQALKNFISDLKNEVGGKMLVRLSEELKEKLRADPQIDEILRLQHHSAPLKFVSKENLMGYIATVGKKEKVQSLLQDNTLQLLVDAKDYAGKYDQLDHFKKTNSRFYV